MFMGHLGIALGAKGLRPEINLGVLCVAAVAPDLVDFAWLSTGRPNGTGLWTHSFTAMLAQAVVFGLVYVLLTRRVADSLVAGAVAGSHVAVDLLTSRMTMWPGGSPMGLHLYVWPRTDFLLEGGVILAGWWLYSRSLQAARRFTWASFTILVVLLVLQGGMETLHIS